MRLWYTNSSVDFNGVLHVSGVYLGILDDALVEEDRRHDATTLRFYKGILYVCTVGSMFNTEL